MRPPNRPKSCDHLLALSTERQLSPQVVVIVWQLLQMCDTIWNKITKNDAILRTWWRRWAQKWLEGNILPRTHCSDRIRLPSGLLPLYFPMQRPACRTVLQTVPPQSWISSTRLWAGGWESGDTNMVGWLWKRSCWCSPADRCLWRRQIWERGNNRNTKLFSCS